MSSRIFVMALLCAAFSMSAVAQPLQLITEENPPLNYRDPATGQLTGAAHEMVLALMAKAQVSYEVDLLPWHRGYRRALETPSSCIYGINRTFDREELFEWVGPLLESGWAFYGYDKQEAFTNITDITDQIVAVKSGDAVATAFAAARPDARVLAVETDAMAVRLLARGRADLWLTGIVHATKNAEIEGVPVPVQKFLWRRSLIYMACEKSTESAVLDKLRAAMPALDSLRDEIIRKYW